MIPTILLALVQATTPPSQVPALVDIHELSPQEHRTDGFVLTAPQQLKISAIGAEPWPDRLRDRDDRHWQDDDQTTWPAAAWILDARTRAVVWDLRAEDTRRESNGLRHFDGTVRLPAGTYEAHYASYPSAAGYLNVNSDISDFRDIVRLARRAKDGGPYVETKLYRQFGITISGAGHPATRDELAAARGAFTASDIVNVVPDRNSTARKGFEVTRPTRVEVYAIGEMTLDDEFDYGWIINAETRQRVWAMSYASTDPAGGAAKNRMTHETLQLKPGKYVAYFVCDETHTPEDWNGVPPADPEFWGLTLRVADASVRASVRPFDYQPVPAGQTIASLIEVRDDEMRSQGFTLKRPLNVRIYALGEGFKDRMADYAWLVDADQHKRVWSMTYANTEHGGGADKNRLFDDTIRLGPGNYMVYYHSDGSHSYTDWNGAPPAEERYWGVSIFPASGRLNPADVAPFRRTMPSGAPLVQLDQMGNNEDARKTFTLDRETRVHILAVGEGQDDELVDYGLIDDANGRTVWHMQYDETEPAGGADKNRAFDGVITLPAGSYVLRYRSDGSHSYNDWNDGPPDDPDHWGIAVFRMARR